MATTKKTNVPAAAEETRNALAVPDFMKADAGKGTESIAQKDVEVPRLVLLQALSPEVTDGDEKAGNFYHTLLEEAFGGKIRAVIVYANIQYILWRPRHEGGGILARADDGVHWNLADAEFEVKPYKDRPTVVKWRTSRTVEESGLDKFGSSDPADPNSQPAAVKMYNFVVVLPDYPEYGPMVVTLQRGAASVGKKLNGKLKLSGLPAFGQVFEITSSKAQNNAGETFYQPQFTRVGLVEDKGDYDDYKALYESFHALGLKVRDLENADESASGGTDGHSGKSEKGIDV